MSEIANVEVARERPAESPGSAAAAKVCSWAELERHGRAAGYPRRAFEHLVVDLEHKRLGQPLCDKNAALRRSDAAPQNRR